MSQPLTALPQEERKIIDLSELPRPKPTFQKRARQWAARKVEEGYQQLMQHTYWREDTLFQILYDKRSRPSLYKQLSNPNFDVSENKEMIKQQINTFPSVHSEQLPQTDISGSVRLSNGLSFNRPLLGYDELIYLESLTENRHHLCLKWPLIVNLLVFCGSTARIWSYLKKGLVFKLYLRVDSPQKMRNNRLWHSMHALNVVNGGASMFSIGFLTWNYSKAVRQRYLKGTFGLEAEMLFNHRNEIALYRKNLAAVV